jgi:transposase InsO family protein
MGKISQEKLAAIVAKSKEMGISYAQAGRQSGIAPHKIYQHLSKKRKKHQSNAQASQSPVAGNSGQLKEKNDGSRIAPTVRGAVGDRAGTGLSDREPSVERIESGIHKDAAQSADAVGPRDGVRPRAADRPCAAASSGDGGPAGDGDPSVQAVPSGAGGGGSLPEEVAEIIRAYRREHPTHGFKRIEDELRTRYLINISRKRIRQTLKEAGLSDPCDSSFDRPEEPPKGTRRFEAEAPGRLYQMDVSYVYLSELPALYLVVLVDDHSRFCVAARLCPDQRAETMIEVLAEACSLHGAPVKLLTDQGSNFYTWSMEPTRFQQWLDERRIEHLVCDPHSPQTQGKVERLIQTIKRELFARVRFAGLAEARAALAQYVDQYNYNRAHQGIGGLCPAERFHGVRSALESLRDDDGVGGQQTLDLNLSYLVWRSQGHTISVVGDPAGIRVMLDGNLLREAGSNESGMAKKQG